MTETTLPPAAIARSGNAPPRLAVRSIQWTLPLLICGLLALVTVVLTVMAYRGMRAATVRTAEARMQAVTQQLTGLLAQSTQHSLADAVTQAKAPALRAYLQSPNTATEAAAVAELHRLVKLDPKSLSAELRDVHGNRVLSSGDFGADKAFTPLAADQEAAIGPLRVLHDTISVAVTSRITGATPADSLGSLVSYVRIAQSTRAIGQLIGPDAQFLIGNMDGSLWTDLEHAVTGPAMNPRTSSGITRDTVDGGRLGAFKRIGPTPWVAWVGMPMSFVVAPARDMLRQLIIVALVILVGGTLAGWWLSRRITTPLLDVTDAADAIAAGDFSRRATPMRHDEVGQLAVAFNSMASQIEEGRRTLEQRVSERTTELRDALDKLSDAQEELVRREKLAFLGQLAGGVGHELRNPLGVMTNAVHYLGLVMQNAPPKVIEYLSILRTQIGLAERIVGDLLDSARVKTPQREPVPAQQLFTDQLSRIAIHRGIQVVTDIAPDTPLLYVDRVQLGQVMLNLITNAVQAIGDREGAVTLRARVDGENRARIEVADTGSGITPEHLERIFEPLFTTKARGLGLGLSVARSLVRANGGELSATSEVGRGSTFALYLPTVPRSTP